MSLNSNSGIQLTLYNACQSPTDACAVVILDSILCINMEQKDQFTECFPPPPKKKKKSVSVYKLSKDLTRPKCAVPENIHTPTKDFMVSAPLPAHDLPCEEHPGWGGGGGGTQQS